MNLKDRIALVTGSSRGIGAAIASELAARGAFVVVNYRADADECGEVDADGTLFLQNIKDIADSESGRGYTSYIWQNPATGKEEIKTSYVVGIELEGETVAVGAGLYGLE